MSSPESAQTPPEAEAEPEFAPLAWARAVALGVRDTLQDMLDEGRRGAREAYEERWERFDAKARKRRRPGQL